MAEVDLSGLRDIHMPIEPEWWPLAYGWWIVIGCVFTLFLIVFLIFRKWYYSPKQYALRELKAVYHKTQGSVDFAKEMSILLKRIAILNYSRKKVAALSEDEWFQFLQAKTKQAFSDEQLNLLSMAVYMPKSELSDISKSGLYTTAQIAVKKLFGKDKHGHTRKKNI